MSNLTVNQRNQYERAGFQERRPRPSAAERRGIAIYVGVALVVLAVLTFAAVQVFDGWHHLIVIGDLIVLLLGIAAWVYPGRRHA